MEKIIESVSPFGKFQKLVLILIGFVSSLTAMVVFSTVFTAARPKFSCYRIDSENHNETAQITQNDIQTCELWTQMHSNQSVAEAHKCSFDTEYYGTTIVTEWLLVCELNFYASLTVTAYMCGSFLSLFIGYLSDLLGRKKVSLGLLTILTLVLLVCQSLQFEWLGLSDQAQYFIYLFAQMLIGACSNSVFMVMYVLLIEITTPRYSTLVSNVNLYMYVFGELQIAFVAYFSRSWHIINWYMIVYSFVLTVVCFSFLPESPRYLKHHKKYKQLYAQLKRIARINKAEHTVVVQQQRDSDGLISPRVIMDSSYFETKVLKLDYDLENETDQSQETKSSNNNVLKYIFKSKEQLAKTILLSFVWFALSMTYYGVSLGITTVGNINPYLMYTFSAVSELIGYALCHFNEKVGRKRLFVIFLAMASLACLAVALIQLLFSFSIDSTTSTVSEQSRKILLATATFAGKAMASAAFNSAYIYASHMFPTGVRNTLLVFVSSVGRFGSVISPQINLLGELLIKQMPYLIFSFSSFLGCIFILILPDPFLSNQL